MTSNWSIVFRAIQKLAENTSTGSEGVSRHSGEREQEQKYTPYESDCTGSGKESKPTGRDRIYRVRLRVAPTLGRYTRRGPILEADARNTVPTGGVHWLHIVIP